MVASDRYFLTWSHLSTSQHSSPLLTKRALIISIFNYANGRRWRFLGKTTTRISGNKGIKYGLEKLIGLFSVKYGVLLQALKVIALVVFEKYYVLLVYLLLCKAIIHSLFYIKISFRRNSQARTHALFNFSKYNRIYGSLLINNFIIK